MEFKKLTEDWKRISICVTAGAVICGAAIGAENHFATAADQRNLQMQVYNLSVIISIEKYQRQIDYLKTQPQTDVVKRQIAWFENEIATLQQQITGQE